MKLLNQMTNLPEEDAANLNQEAQEVEIRVFQETGEALTANLGIASLEKKAVVQNQMPVMLQSLQAINQKDLIIKK